MNKEEINFEQQPIGKSVKVLYVYEKTNYDPDNPETDVKVQKVFWQKVLTISVKDVKGNENFFVSVNAYKFYFHDHRFNRQITQEGDFKIPYLIIEQSKAKKISFKEAMQLYAKGLDIYMDSNPLTESLRISIMYGSRFDWRERLGIKK
jgi:hypothetical protein